MAGCGDVGGFADHDAQQVAPDYFSFQFDVVTPIFSTDPGPMPKTADFFDYLNSHRCR